MSDRRVEPDALDEVGRASIEPVEHRDVRCRGRILAEKYPDVPLDLARRIAAGMGISARKNLAPPPRPGQGGMPPPIQPPPRPAGSHLAPRPTARPARHAP